MCHIFLAFAMISQALGAYKGFNYGAEFSDQRAKRYADYVAEFNLAQSLVDNGVDHPFTSARLYTSIQADTGEFNEAFKAAVDTKTTILVGIWISGGSFDVELGNLTNAIYVLGEPLVDLIVGIAVGSEDVYRTTPRGVSSNLGPGVVSWQVSDYIQSARDTLSKSAARGKPVGHVDTSDVFADPSNNVLISNSDFIGMNSYPYYGGIEVGESLTAFWHDYIRITMLAQDKPVWITETGWPTSGVDIGPAVPGIADAAMYYSEVGCHAFDMDINIWWYTLQDEDFEEPTVAFGVIGPGEPSPVSQKYDLTCREICQA